MSITNPNYFRAGAQFPPPGDSTRQANFARYKALYQNDGRAYSVLYYQRATTPATQRRFANLDTPSNAFPKYRINLFRKLSNFWKDMLFSFPPTVSAQSRGENRNIDDLLNKILLAAPKVAIDTSRFGTGVYLLTTIEDGEIRVEAIETPYWFPVVDANDQRKILGDIIAVPYNSDPESPFGLYGDRIRVSRYIIGEPATVQTFKLESNTLSGGGEILQGGIVEQRAVITVPNGYEVDHYGESDYPDLIDPVAEINTRLSGLANVLDRHTNPHMQGPRSAVTNSAGRISIDQDGNYFPLEEGDPLVAYVTWDSNADANFTQMSKALDYFFAMSNTSSTALGLQEGGRAAESGAALRKLLYSSFLRLSGLRRAHEAGIRAAVRAVFPRMDVTITWPDPFLDGAIEEASAEEIRLRSGTSTPTESISRLDQVSAGEADRIAETAEQIRTRRADEAMARGAAMGAQRGQTGDGGGPNDTTS